MAQVTGRVYISIDGALLETKEGAKASGITGVERTAVVGNSVHGYSEKAVAPKIECKISHKANTSLINLGKTTNASIRFACDTGPVYVLRGAWLENAIDLTAGEGETDLTFSGVAFEEIL